LDAARLEGALAAPAEADAFAVGVVGAGPESPMVGGSTG
tara:strand:- start:1082 stop:1198 length:117 start_codon:yes stop_codon:yes gene_type:complete